ncbi:MAG: WD40 repeat domain-containing protein [Planctomycetes bacterium]|nr:WD40 repeat domain-containing protein [Planctomycetota bacterium]
MTPALLLTALSVVSCSLAPLGNERPAERRPATREDQGRLLFKHRRAAQCLAFTADGKTLASGGQDAEILIYDMEAGSEPRKLTGHRGPVTALAFDGEGRLHSGEMYQSVMTWNVADGTTTASAKEHGSRVTAMTWLAGPNLLASVSIDKSVRLWNPADLKPIATLEGHKFNVQGVVPLDGGRWMATCDDGGNVVFWEVEPTAEKSRFAPEERLRFACMAGSPDGKTLVLGDDREQKIYLFDVEKSAIVKTIEGARARSLAFSPDGETFAVGTHDNRVLLQDAKSGEVLGTFKDHGRAVLAVAFSPDGKQLASGAMDGAVRLWNVPQR